MRYEDLTPALKAQVDQQVGKTPRRRRSQKAATEGTTISWRCGECGEVCFSLAAMERHVDDHGGGRYECILV